MRATNTAGDVVRTPTIQPEAWQPGETRDLSDAEARALAGSAHFALNETTPVQATPVEAQPALIDAQPAPEPAGAPTAPADPSPFAAQPTL